MAELEAATLAVTVAQQEVQLAQSRLHRRADRHEPRRVAADPGHALSAIGSPLVVASPAAFLALEESVRKFVGEHVDDVVREQAKDVLGIIAAWTELRLIVEHPGHRPARPAARQGFRPLVVQ